MAILINLVKTIKINFKTELPLNETNMLRQNGTVYFMMVRSLKHGWSTKVPSVIAMDAICATLDGPQPEARVVIECEDNARGRYLVIQIDGVNSFLALCEVEVFTAKGK